jgi:ribosome maturation factor RimP
MTETQLDIITGFVNSILEDNTELFLVSLKIKTTNNIKVYVDGDNGITVENCIRINRKLYKLIEEKGMYPEGDFSLEISSPGVDEPLKLYRQYKKNIGRNVEVVFADDTKQEGKLFEATETDILIETTEGKGKKAVTQQVLIPLANIKKAVVQIKF